MAYATALSGDPYATYRQIDVVGRAIDATPSADRRHHCLPMAARSAAAFSSRFFNSIS